MKWPILNDRNNFQWSVYIERNTFTVLLAKSDSDVIFCYKVIWDL